MILIKTDGSAHEMPLKTDLESLQQLVEGYIEFFYFADGSALVVNEEGRIKGMVPNPGATSLTVFKKKPESIVGPAVFLSKAEMEQLKREEHD